MSRKRRTYESKEPGCDEPLVDFKFACLRCLKPFVAKYREDTIRRRAYDRICKVCAKTNMAYAEGW